MEKNYQPKIIEPKLMNSWQLMGIYHFDIEKHGQVFSIDTPPATVSGNLHMGHIYSYTHADIIARFKRMQGYKVFYPMGYDDNGLPTDRLVEKKTGYSASQIDRQSYQKACIEISQQYIHDYTCLWQRIGLSFDERFSYRTIDHNSQRISQWSFLHLYKQGRIYHHYTPAIWCPECHTSLSQADLEDQQFETEYIFIPFYLASSEKDTRNNSIVIATTRPELLAACVNIFVNPQDTRYHQLAGSSLIVPLYGQSVPVTADPTIDPHKGSGVVMCCTFGDATDIAWWRKHNLPVIDAIRPDGRMCESVPFIGGIPIAQARLEMISLLEAQGYLADRRVITHEIRVHERCKTPVEYIPTKQWFVRLLDEKQSLTYLGQKINWHPEHMAARYHDWVENLGWDWCLSRQRAYGVPFPVWYCQSCGEILLADQNQLPVDPFIEQPARACDCGNNSFLPETDVMDTWATSALTPQIAANWQPEVNEASENLLYQQVSPYSLRPHSQEIIRTWDFYTIAKSKFHFNQIPWKDVLISGWGLAGAGMGKISKSRHSQVKTPEEMIDSYSADAIRYWAASTGPGKDSLISEEKIAQGSRLITKLWNIALFCSRFLSFEPLNIVSTIPDRRSTSLADRWILSRLQNVIESSTSLLNQYEYAAAKSEIETFCWKEFADNYIEMAKQRLYDPQHPQNPGASFTIQLAFSTLLKLWAPFLPFVTEQIFQELYAENERDPSIHISSWPQPDTGLIDADAEKQGERLIEIATAVRRYKSEHSLPLGLEVKRLQLAARQIGQNDFEDAIEDIKSITRARVVEICQPINPDFEICHSDNETIAIALEI
jgi:valyl-tRNA synthetase